MVMNLEALEQEQEQTKSKDKQRKKLDETEASKKYAEGKAMVAAGEAEMEEARPAIEAAICDDAAEHTAEDGYTMGPLKIDVSSPRAMAADKAQAYRDSGRDYEAIFPVTAQTPEVIFGLLSEEMQKTFYAVLQTLDRAAGGDAKAAAILARAAKAYRELDDRASAARGGVIKVKTTRTLSEGVTARKFLQGTADLDKPERDAYLDACGLNASIKMDRKVTNDLVKNVCIL